MRFRSARGGLIQRTQDIMREILKIERGDWCEICGVRRENMGVFHILPVGKYPRIRFQFENVLLSCWIPCHFNWHQTFKAAKEIDKKIKQLRGEDYEDRLALLDRCAPKLTQVRIQMTHDAFKAHLSNIRGKSK